MKKRIIAIGLLAALTISIGAMAGCGSSGSESGASSSGTSATTYVPTEGADGFPKDNDEFDLALENKLATLDYATINEPVTIEGMRFKINAFDMAVRIAYWIDYLKTDDDEELNRKIAVPSSKSNDIMIGGGDGGTASIYYDDNGYVKEIKGSSSAGKTTMMYVIGAALYGPDIMQDFPDIFNTPGVQVGRNNYFGTFVFENTKIEVSGYLTDDGLFFVHFYPMR